MTVVQELEWTTLTPLANEVKPVQMFLNRMLFGQRIPVSTDLLEIGTLVGDRSAAPFTTKDAEAVMVEGLTSQAITIRPPNIRIKKPFTPSSLLFNRDFGETIYLGQGDDQVDEVNMHIARDTQRMVDLIANAEEFLASQALTGSIAYTNEQDVAAFEINYAKSAENTVALTGADRWSESTSDPKIDVLRAKRRLAEAVNLQPTDAVMGTEAAEAFLANSQIASDLDNRNLISGNVDITNQFNEQGVIFLGTWAGLRWWEYGRQINVPGSGLTNLIRPKFVEFVTPSPAAEQVMYFGAIRDMEAFQGRNLRAERFSKSWTQKDPSAIIQLVESHPLATMRRPDSVYSLQVVS